MFIVIPVGPSDADNLSLLTKAIIRLGFIQTPILLVSVPSLQAAANEAAASLQDVAPSVSVIVTDGELPGAWPIGPDRMFLWVIQYLEKTGNNHPWLWLEPDACPVKPHWDKLLRDDYKAQGQPYYGFVKPTVWRNADGTSETRTGDNTLMGVAIYPPNMLKDQELVPLLNDLAHADPRVHPPYPWDIGLRWVFFRRGVHASTLIHDKWRTCNYVRGEFDTFFCDPVDEKSKGGTVPEEAVLVHGCKDGSLHRLIIGEPKLEERFKYLAAPKNSTLAEIRESEVNSIVEQVSDKAETFGVLSETTSEAADKLAPARLLLQAIEKYDAPRLNSILSDTGFTRAEVDKLLPQIGYTIARAGWIKKL